MFKNQRKIDKILHKLEEKRQTWRKSRKIGENSSQIGEIP